MQREIQMRLMRRVLNLLEQGATDAADSTYLHDVGAYHSSKRLELETGILFRQLPLVVGLSSTIPSPGDHFTDDSAGVPLLLTRAADGRVRAFLNVCRHRGSRLAQGCGHVQTLICPYHGWTYALDGQLLGIPDHRNFPGVERQDYGLVALPAAERHGMIWVTPKPDLAGSTSLDIQSCLRDLDSEVGAYGLESYHRFDSREVRCKANWKLVMDTFLEPYHFKVLHSKTVSKVFIGNVCLFEPFGRHLREVFPRHTILAQKDVPENEWDFMRHTTIVYILFPNTALVWQLDHVEIWRVHPVPGRADESVMHLDFIVPNPIETDSARGHWQRSMDLTVDTVLKEDLPTAEGIQKGATSGALAYATIGRNEPAVAHFERGVSEEVGDLRARSSLPDKQ